MRRGEEDVIIGSEAVYFFLFIGFVLSIICVATSGSRSSNEKIQKTINEYENTVNRCNVLIGRICATIEEMKSEYFVSSADEERAVSLVKEYNDLHSEMVDCNDRIGFYLEKRNISQYKKYIKRVDCIIAKFQEIYDSLMDVERYMQTKEEWDFYHRKNEQASSHWDEYQSYEKETPTETKTKEKDGFFGGCRSREEIEQRYRALAKVYHPDMPSGDKEMFQKMLEEYERKKKGI